MRLIHRSITEREAQTVPSASSVAIQLPHLAAQSKHQRLALPSSVNVQISPVKRRIEKSQRRTGANPWLTLSSHGANLNIEDFLTFKITRLSNALRTNLTKRYLEEFDLSLPEWRLLALVTRFSPLRFSEVTARSSMDKGQVSRTLRTMTKRGLTKTRVVRHRSSPAAEALAAPVIVSITPRGRLSIGRSCLLLDGPSRKSF